MSFRYRQYAARLRFGEYLFFTILTVVVIIIGYSSSNSLSPVILIMMGSVSLYLAHRCFKRFSELSADISVFDQTFENQTFKIVLAYEIPPELNRPDARMRISYAAQEALDRHLSESGSTKRDDLKSVVRQAVSTVINDYGVHAFNVRIASITSKTLKYEGIKIGYDKSD